MPAAGAVWGWRRAPVGLRLAGAVGGANAEGVRAPAHLDGDPPLHPRGIGERQRQLGLLPGAFVELDEGIEGLIHISEFDDSHGGEKIDLQAGNTYQMKIIKLSPQERKIGLSIRALKSDEFRADWEAYQESEGTGTATLGDHFRNR